MERIKGINERIIWNRVALSKWMHKVGGWLQKLLSIGHLVAGQPARGEEFLSCAIGNTPTQARGMYFVDDLMMLFSLYGKADNLRGSQRPIVRFLCRDTSFLLINYLTCIRDMEVVASKVLDGAEETDSYNHALPIKEGKRMSSHHLLESISRAFQKHLKVPSNLNSWRHMAIACMDRFLKHSNVSRTMCNGPLDSQAGHSQQAASRIYRRSNFDHPNIERDEFQLYRSASVE